MANITRIDPFDDLFRGFFVRPVDFDGAPAQPPSIKMDVKEQGDCYLIHADLPGVKKEDIHVVVDGSQVSLSAEVKQEKETKEGERVLRSERYFGKVSRSFQLGQDIDDSKAVARFNDGVLELSLPKRAESSSRRACKNFCVNGHPAGNCHIARSDDDRRKESSTEGVAGQPVG